jgi:hypothetical protein
MGLQIILQLSLDGWIWLRVLVSAQQLLPALAGAGRGVFLAAVCPGRRPLWSQRAGFQKA